MRVEMIIVFDINCANICNFLLLNTRTVLTIFDSHDTMFRVQNYMACVIVRKDTYSQIMLCTTYSRPRLFTSLITIIPVIAIL